MSRSKRRKNHRGATSAAGNDVQTRERRPRASFGAQLLRARNDQGISHEDVARETRVPKRYLLALEDESIGSLPGGVYNRAYLRTYAEYLGLDADSVLSDYDRTVQAQAAAPPDQMAALQAAIQQRESRAAEGNGAARTANVRAIAGAAALVVLAAGVWIGARRVTFPAGISVASFSTPAVPVVNLRPDNARITERAAAPKPPAAPAPRAPEPVPARPAATPVPAAVEKSTQLPRSEEFRASESISVTDSGVGTDVVNRELVGRADTFAVGTRVVFWTHVVGGRAGSTIRHVWLHEGRPVATVALPVRSASWRTQSQRMLAPGADGDWTVEARDEGGRVLAQHTFHCGP